MKYRDASLENYPLTEAKTLLLEIDDSHGIIPARSRDALFEATDRIVQHAQELRVRNVDDLVRESASVIASTSGVMRGDLGQFLDPPEAAAAHTYRNVLLTLVLVTVADFGGDHTRAAGAISGLKQRGRGRTLRSCADDEILASRAWTWALSLGNERNRRSAAIYALVEAGVIPGETTMLRSRDVVLDWGLEMVAAPGLRTAVTGRVIELDAFNAALLRAHVDNTTIADHELLTYRPRKTPTGQHEADYNRAAATTAGVLDRIHQAVGLKDQTLSAASIWKWRAEHTMYLEGISAAAGLVGRSTASLRETVLKDVPRQSREPRAKKTFSIAC